MSYRVSLHVPATIRAVVLSLATLGVAVSADAQVLLPITNAGFESPLQPAGSFSSSGIVGWNDPGTNSRGVWHFGAGFFNVPPPEGVQIGYTNIGGGFEAQQLSSLLSVGQYTFSVQAGKRIDGFNGTIQIELWAGGTVASGVVTGGTMLSSASLTSAQQTTGQFVLLSTPTYTATSSDPLLGQNLAVRIGMLSGTQVDFDDARLSFTAPNTGAPEPASLWLAVSGLGALGIARRPLRS